MTLTILTDPILGDTPHGFFTRTGGASSGVFKGLNCGHGSSDQSAAVTTNRGRVAEAMKVAPSALVSVYQVHSNDVIEVREPWSGDLPKVDAMVSNTPDIALGILTADCAPVLFSDPVAGVVGAAHAGWKGALTGVTDRTIEAMEKLGATRENITASVGPCISQAAYEVGPEFFENFAGEDHAYTRFFTNGEGDRMLFDLPSFVLARVRTAEIDASWIGRCTYSEPKHFYSYRRTTHAGEADYGRLISVIKLRSG